MYFKLYFILYLFMHSFLIYKNENTTIRFHLGSTVFRIWLVSLDMSILAIVPFYNNLLLWNSYPIWYIFSVVFYYITRHCLRNLSQYQYLVHLYHPETQVYYLGHYYKGFSYSLSDFAIKLFIVATCLNLNIVIAILFLITMSGLDTWFYYNNISDNTGETFHKIVGFIFQLVHKKD